MRKPKVNGKIEDGSIKTSRILAMSECLAKTEKKDSVTTIKGRNVLDHCLIVGHVAQELIKRYPSWLVGALFPAGSDLIAAIHDVGKISPAFQEKIHRSIGIKLGIANPELDKTIGYHWTVSQAAIDLPGMGKYLPEIIGRHHGISPISGLANDENYGGMEWQRLREQLIAILKESLHTDDWPTVQSPVQADLLSGLTTVADWIGSSSMFDINGNNDKWDERVVHALDNAGFIKPQIRKGLSFESVFKFKPHLAQSAFTKSITGPGVYVLEAPMGIGKTEAALYAAYNAMEENRATGIYFALPTQLTSDKVYERVNKFLEVVLESDCPHRKSLLLHGAAWLKQTELGEDGQPGKSWFDGNKRGLLAPFAVGTIDQALMAAMNVKHGFVRTFGLAGKVVILDEVHSYDSYTGTLLDQLVNVLREIHCTVIILSATLTGKRRNGILGIKESVPTIVYPLISCMPKESICQEIDAGKIEDAQVELRVLSGDAFAIEDVLTRAERGEQVLWVENTVDGAQKMYQELAGRASSMKIECGLLHSRFLKTDRALNEQKWVDLYGKNSKDLRKSLGRILVGTQVLEQSLDIDADFLVTRICPIDMLFQRIGRLWRHRGNDAVRPADAKREAWILAPDIADAIERSDTFGKTAMVYAPYVLCRTLEVLQGLTTVALPGDIRQILEATYEERTEIGEMNKYKIDLIEKRVKLQNFANIGISRGGITKSESKASTRYTERENVEVLLIRSKRLEQDGMHVRLLDETEIILSAKPRSIEPKKWRSTAAQLQRNTVNVPEYLAPQCSIQQLDWLKEYVYIGDNDENPFRAAFVQNSGDLIGLGQDAHPLDGYTLRYDPALGYVARKNSNNTSD